MQVMLRSSHTNAPAETDFRVSRSSRWTQESNWQLAVGQRFTQKEVGLGRARGADERGGLFTLTPDADTCSSATSATNFFTLQTTEIGSRFCPEESSVHVTHCHFSTYHPFPVSFSYLTM